MPMTMDINAVKEQMHIKDNSGYAFLDSIVQSAGMPAEASSQNTDGHDGSSGPPYSKGQPHIQRLSAEQI